MLFVALLLAIAVPSQSQCPAAECIDNDADKSVHMLQVGAGRQVRSQTESKDKKRTSDSPNGWLHDKNEGSASALVVHIPKTAGVSLTYDLDQVLPADVGLYSSEQCSWYTKNDKWSEGDHLFSLVRKPIPHVQSLYMECKYDEDWHMTPKRQEYLLDNLSIWLEHFHSSPDTADFLLCYHPLNLQTRYFSENRERCHNHGEKEDLNTAKTVIEQNFSGVGLVEHYQESFCVFHAKVMPAEPLPSFCNCEDAEAWRSFQTWQNRSDHGLPAHSVEDLSPEELSMIADLTTEDEKLYDFVKARFIKQLEEVEQDRGVRLRCPGVTEPL